MDKKYTENKFFQFLEMIYANYLDKKGRVELNEENVNDLILMYVHIEGEEEFKELKREVEEIVKNNDLPLFKGRKFNDLTSIKFVSEVVLKHK